MSKINVACLYCGLITAIESYKENTKIKCQKCKKDFIAYKTVNCHGCGKEKHPNHKCRNCDAASTQVVDTVDVLKTLINPFSAFTKLAGNVNSQDNEVNQESESDNGNQENSLPETKSGTNLHPAEKISIGDLTALVKSNLQALWAGDEEMAKATGLAQGTLKSRLGRAREALRQVLEEEGKKNG